MNTSVDTNTLGRTAFSDRYKVETDKPLPEFDTPGGTAYSVKDSDQPGRSLYCVVQEPTVAVRNEVYKSLRASPLPNLICPADRGLAQITVGAGRQRLVTVFQRPTGGVLLDANGKLNNRVNSTRLRQSIVLSLLKALAGLHKRGITHRFIQPSRIFFTAPDSDEVLLGECVTMPPGFRQPMALEPLEGAFTTETGRGGGGASTDYFQLGATLMCLYFGQPLWTGRQRDSFLMARVNQGSYWAMSGGRDVPGALGSLVKGLMADAFEERWGAQEILDWYEGLQKPKRTSLKAWTMSRPTNFKGVAYVDRRLLADAFGQDPVEAAHFLRSLDFPVWAQTALRDEVLTERTESMLGVRPAEGAYSTSQADDNRMVTRVCLFLHPVGPIRYRGLSFFIDGLPAMLADAFARDDRDVISAISEILDGKFLSSLAEVVGDRNPVLIKHANDMKRMFDFIRSKNLGRGMERVLYEMNPALPCLSQRFERFWVASNKQFTKTMEILGADVKVMTVLLDRHVAAFCAAHGQDLDGVFYKLASAQNDRGRFAVMTADFFGQLQQSLQLGPLPRLTEAVVDGLAPAVKGLKDRARREKVQSLLDKAKKGGDISRLVSEINLERIQLEDERQFGVARTTIMRLDRERGRLMRKVTPQDPEAQQKGYRAARVVAFATFLLVSASQIF
ncbi:hypothetical protein BXY39_0326 [Eilatimonas milleporae]|uniref:Protein kinase domain-containing protein n=1 Tax=Eilatimonas milleporae TaxID=911205 RepID=A0A3M0CQL8_9PROT|nr:hypothetical protein BXY39_0326 [Eilatimonas milleporae]